MDDKLLTKLALTCSIFGLLFLFITSLYINPKQITIADLENTKEKDVLIRGRVTSIKNFESIALVEIAELKTANVVVFDKRLLKFGVGDNISVSGELRDYKGKKEVVAEKIRKLK